MKVSLGYGSQKAEFDVADSKVVRVHQSAAAPALSDPPAAIRAAIDHPLGFPALQQALTPDDHITIVVDEHLPQVGRLLTPILERVTAARISPELITLLGAPGSKQSWVDDIPDAFQDVRLEVHDPNDRNKLSYLAATKRGHRVYLNRTLVDADQGIILTGRGYDPLLGYSGAATAIFPTLSDQATRVASAARMSMEPPPHTGFALAAEAAEVCWLLGSPFFVQVIDGADSDIAHVLAGLVDTSATGQKLLDERWRIQVDAPADVVVAGIGSEPERQRLDDVARAFANASRVVKPGGRIFVLSAAESPEDDQTRLLSQSSDPTEVLKWLHEHPIPDFEAAYLWANAAQRASLFLLSNMHPNFVEEMFVTPIENHGQVQRVLDSAGSVIFLADAHKSMAEVRAGR